MKLMPLLMLPGPICKLTCSLSFPAVRAALNCSTELHRFHEQVLITKKQKAAPTVQFQSKMIVQNSAIMLLLDGKHAAAASSSWPEVSGLSGLRPAQAPLHQCIPREDTHGATWKGLMQQFWQGYLDCGEICLHILAAQSDAAAAAAEAVS